MAMEKWQAKELRVFGESLMSAGRKIMNTADMMSEEKFTDLVLQARTAIVTYAPAIVALASLVESEFIDQRDALRFGRPPRWLVNQKKIEAKKEKKDKMIEMSASRKVSKKLPQKERKPSA